MKHFSLVMLILLIAVTSYAQPLDTGLIDDSSPVLDFLGSWSSVALVEAYGGSYQQTSDYLASLSFETYAPGFEVLFYFDPLGDSAELCIDLDCTTFSTLGAIAPGELEVNNLGSGLKEITISKVTNDASLLGIDGIYIYPDQPETNRGVENTFTLDGETYTGSIEYVLTAGDSLIVIMLSLVILLLLFIFINQLMQRESE